MDYLVVEILLYLALAFAIGFIAGRLIHALGPARGATSDRIAVAESLAATREAEARQLRNEIVTARERLRIAEAEAAAAQADVSRANTQFMTARTDSTRKIMALEEEVAALKRPKPVARVAAPDSVRVVEPAAAPAPSAIASPAAPPALAALTSTPAPTVTKPTPAAPPTPPAAIVVEPLPLVASMEVPPATAPTVVPPPAAVAPVSQPAELPPDDLKEIVGIGPILEHTLQSLGLKTFAQIASITPEDIAMLIVKVDSSIAERVLRERWVEQARELYAKKYGKAAA
jgi:predicted flap endonuclease-1-like 5' DNA nuclease